MRRIAKMPLWAESRIHGDVYVRFGGRLSETYHRKVAWRRQPSLPHADPKTREAANRITLTNVKDGLQTTESENNQTETNRKEGINKAKK